MTGETEYPREVNASVLLLDGEIYNWKIGNQFWAEPHQAKMRYDEMPLAETGRFTVANKTFTVNSQEENNEAFNVYAVEWFKQYPISEKHIGAKCY